MATEYDYIEPLYKAFTVIDLAILAVPERPIDDSIRHACKKMYKKLPTSVGKSLLKSLAYEQNAAMHYNRLRERLPC